MIFTLFIYVVGWLIGLIVSLLALLGQPTLPADMASATASAMVYLANLDYFVPTAGILLAISFTLLAETAWFAYQGIRWCYQKIPSIN